MLSAPEAHYALVGAALCRAPAAGRAVLAPVLDAVGAGAVRARAARVLAPCGAVDGLRRTGQAGPADPVVVLHAPAERVFVVIALRHSATSTSRRGWALLGDGLHSQTSQDADGIGSRHTTCGSRCDPRGEHPRCEPGGPGCRGAAYRASTTATDYSSDAPAELVAGARHAVDSSCWLRAQSCAAGAAAFVGRHRVRGGRRRLPASGMRARDRTAES